MAGSVNLPEGFELVTQTESLQLPEGFELIEPEQATQPEPKPQKQDNGFGWDDVLSMGKKAAVDTLTNAIPGAKALKTASEVIDTPEKATGTVNALAQGATLGFADEIQAATLAGVGTALPEEWGGLPEGKTLGENYRGVRDAQRELNKEFREEEPVLAYGGEIVGGLATGGTGMARAGVTTAKAAGNVVNAAKAGAKMGGATGLGMSEAELGDVGNMELGEAAFDTGAGSLTGFVAGGSLGLVAKKLAQRGIAQQEIKNLIERSPDGNVADKVITQAGKVATHAEAKAALSQGLPEGTVAHIRVAAMDKTNRINMQRMVNLYKRALRDHKFRDNNTMSEIVGTEALKRYKGIELINKQAAKQIKAAKEGLAGKSINIAEDRASFLDKLEQAGVNVKNAKFNFDSSDFALDGKAKRSLQFIANHLNKGDMIDAKLAHNLKRRIDGLVEYGAGNKSGAKKQSEAILKELRHALNQNLKGISREYDIANQKYANTIEVMNEVKSLVGKNGLNPGTFGTLLRRKTAEGISKTRVSNIYAAMDDVAEQYGLRFKGSVDELNTFKTDLESFFPTLARNSYKSETKRANIEAIGDVVTGNPVSAVIKTGTKAIDKMRGVDVDSQLDAITKLLASNTNFKQAL